MKKILGNFLTQANKDFPLDAETLDYLQTLALHPGILGNIAGDKVVLYGCELSDGGEQRAPGYLFLRTHRMPEGEVLYWEGGATASGMYVRQEDVRVDANNISYPKAYTERSVAPGIGVENYSWDEFHDIKNIRELMDENRKLGEAIQRLTPAPLGIVEMWAGTQVPDGYLLCDGRQLREDLYPELFAAIGRTFNSAPNESGIPYSTPAGFFRLPDLRGRFIVGRHDSDTDYVVMGSAGGLKKVALSTDEIPSHSHEVKDYMLIPNGSGECRAGTWTVNGQPYTVGYDTISGNPLRTQTDDNHKDNIQWIQHKSEASGKGAVHENRPPYYVLAYIMRYK